ncbi:FMN-binding split barrel-related protein [Penicillium cosmopolitanum]|uniref:FMN-binding split barrel-related protein n=1 Tax=Penicillium cosmopolitanum TaxID=1131564 RepID=A0A9W9W5N1_9EURO|nr:FMN-binding split barrel-related protein [Penicillium cosmopolitanum]KAJ5403748.1 FMN-binding split barrel-related protein [Penicillium cosmopolitanum]
MHLRAEHAVTDLPTLHTFIRTHPLGVLTTSLPSENFPTLQCSHIPWVLDGVDVDGDGDAGKNLGTLRGHIARANPHTKALIEAVMEAGAGVETGPNSVVKQQQKQKQQGDRQGQGQGQDEEEDQEQQGKLEGQGQGQVLPGEVLIVFTSPVDHYITPQFYTASVGSGSGKVAPTWNYAAVQVYGRMVVYHSVKEKATGGVSYSAIGRFGEGWGGGDYGNGSVGGDESESEQGRSPWRIADAPVEYISMLKKGIVGMEVEITRVEGRFKGSQEKGVADREGVIGGLEGMGGSRATEMADFVRDMSGGVPRG